MERRDDDDGEASLLLRLLQLPCKCRWQCWSYGLTPPAFCHIELASGLLGELGDAGYTVSFGMFDQGIG